MGFSPEYVNYKNSAEWRALSLRIKGYTGWRCSLKPWHRATDSHHLTYRNMGHELFVRDCIPLCRNCHNSIDKSPIGAWFWNDINGRRVWMNHALRGLAVIVAFYAIFKGDKPIGKPKRKK